MNKDQRQYLTKKITDSYRDELEALKKHKPERPSLNNFIVAEPDTNDYVGRTVRITNYKGDVEADDNITKGSIHTIVAPPAANAKKFPNSVGTVCEFEFVAADASPEPTATDTPPPKKKRSTPPASADTAASEPTVAVVVPDTPHAAAIQLVETELLGTMDSLDTVKALQNAQGSTRKLTPDEKERLAYYEANIDDGLKNYVVVGKWLFAIWHDKLFAGEFTSWRDYVKTRWKMTASGAYDLMKAFKTWRLATSDENMTFADAVAPTRWLTGNTDAPPADDVPDSKPTSDAAAPSQRAIEELAKVTPYLSREDMSDGDFAEFEKLAIKFLYETVTELVAGGFTQKGVREVMDAFLEFAKSRTFEIDGEQVKLSGSDFRITKGMFEQLMAEKQALREHLDAARKRMSAPATRPNAEFSMVPDPNAEPDSIPQIQFVRCSHHGDCKIVRIMYGAIQLSCGDVFGMAKDAEDIAFNPKLTKDNPLGKPSSI